MKYVIPSNARYLKLYEPLIQICEGDVTAAAILQILNSMPEQDGWIAADVTTFMQWGCGMFSRRTAVRGLEYIVKSGLVNRKHVAGTGSMYALNSELIESKITTHAKMARPSDTANQRQNGATQESNPRQNGATTHAKMARHPRQNGATSSDEISSQVTENNGSYEESVGSLINYNKEENKEEERREEKNRITEESFAIAHSTAYAVAPAYECREEEKNKNQANTPDSEDCSAIMASSHSLQAEKKRMNKNEILQQVLQIYAKIPEKKRDAKCKGSASRLMQNWGDQLMPMISDIGGDAIVAMENFCQDEYWIPKGLPLNALKKHYQRYVLGAEPPASSNGDSKVKSYGESYSRASQNYVDVQPVPKLAPTKEFIPVARKQETLSIASLIGGSFLANCRNDIGHKLDQGMIPLIEKWHDLSIKEYKRVFGTDYPVCTESIKGVA